MDEVRGFGPPSSDIGAETQARFRYQAEIAARHCIAMLTDARVVAVVCEWFEDFVVIYQDGSAALVSVKHREGTRGPWRLADLASEALIPLFRRWLESGRKARQCRLSTNGALASGPREAAGLKRACDEVDSGELDRFAALLAPRMEQPLEDVRLFLSTLDIEGDLPGRLDISLSCTAHQMRPALATMGFDEALAPDVYEAIVGSIETASRITRDARANTFPVINEPGSVRRQLELDSLLRARTITVEEVRAAVRSALTRQLPPLAPLAAPADSSTMVRKLRDGGLGETLIASAVRLRGVWYETEARFRTGLPGDDLFEDLRTRVLAIAADAESAAISRSREPEPYGPAMHAALVDLLAEAPVSSTAGLRLDVLHLRGLAYQMTDECSIWWARHRPAS